LLRENKVIAGTGVIKKLEYSSYEHIFMHRGKHQINKIIEIPHYEKDLALFIYFTYPYSEIDYHFTLIKIIKTEELKKYDFVETGVEILYSGTTPTFKPIISHAIHFRNGPIRLS